MTRIVIITGISGSGKSTLARKMCDEVIAKGGKAHMVAADDWFTKGDKYEFNAADLGYAHGYCYSKFMSAVEECPDLVVLHNTGTQALEVSPYVLFGSAYGIEAEVVTIDCDPQLAASRNTHGLTLDTVKRQSENLSRRQLPKYWKTRTVKAEV